MKKARNVLFTAALLSGLSSQAQRVVLIEQFTNSGCPPCAASTPQVMQIPDNHPDTVVAIAYHTSFPYNDSMYYENPAESNARVACYSVGSVPYSVIDGNFLSGSSGSLLPNLEPAILSRSAIAPLYSIQPLQAAVTGNTLQVSFAFLSLSNSNISDSLRAHIVVIEKTVLKSAYLASPGNNSETFYSCVMRKMLPGSGGSFLLNRQASGTDTISLSWNLQHIKSLNELRVVAFVQNTATKEVYNAGMVTPSVPSGIVQPDAGTGVYIWPNPAQSGIWVETGMPFTGKLVITDMSGRETGIAFPVQSGTNGFPVNLETLAPGAYLLRLSNENTQAVKRIIVE